MLQAQQEEKADKSKLTLEQRTLQRIANLEANNSITIDCNALVKDGDVPNQVMHTETNSRNDQDERRETNALNPSVLT